MRRGLRVSDSWLVAQRRLPRCRGNLRIEGGNRSPSRDASALRIASPRRCSRSVGGGFLARPPPRPLGMTTSWLRAVGALASRRLARRRPAADARYAGVLLEVTAHAP